ncbi:MAG: primosomal protein N' [Armatimonadota bacterium]
MMQQHPDAKLHAQVAIEAAGGAGGRTYTYLIPDALRDCVRTGVRVLVPFGPRQVSGYVVGLTPTAPPVRLRPITRVLEDAPVAEDLTVSMAEWIATQWRAPVAECLRLFRTPGGQQKTEERFRLVCEDLGKLARAPRQLAIAQALAELGGETTIRPLIRRLRQSTWPNATASRVRSVLRALREAKIVRVEQGVRAPSVRPLERKQVRLKDPAGALQALDELRTRAPRQALVLQTLLAAHPKPLPAAELAASAVNALQRRHLVQFEDAVQERRPDTVFEDECDFLRPLGPQQTAIDRVTRALSERAFTPILLHGITGSGKTEVYLHCLRETLRAGRTGIVLVPEISLTPQIVGRIAARFGSRVAVLHSALSAGERHDEWQRLRRGEATIAVGPRSALFAPLENLGLLVIDEEHEPAYKQDTVPRYHARTVAWELARRHGAVLLLGSATPDVETYYRATQGEMELFELPERVDSRPLPEVRIVDLSKDVFIGEGRTFSEPLRAAMEDAIGRGEQVILFLNRRGFSTFITCRGCGWHPQCPHCGVSLIYHHRMRQVQCHYCGYMRRMPQRCESCGCEDVSFLGLGTERVAEQLSRRFPGVSVARMDRDSVRRKGSHREILAAFARGEVQVLVGTQLVAKGLDFPAVTLVGVLNADVGLRWPDFRAIERTFQLLTQVAGRAGRGDKPGLVLIQTYNPDNPALQAARDHDFCAFYRYEIAKRQKPPWPPFVQLARLLFTDEDQARAHAAAQTAVLALRNMGILEHEGPVHYVGPAPAPLERLRGRWRFYVVLKATERDALLGTIDDLLAQPEIRQASVTVDIDPMDML